MKLPRIRRRKSDMSRSELLDGMRALAQNINVQHQHTVEQKPIPKPESARVQIFRDDGSTAWMGSINCGRQAYTRLRVPLVSIDTRFSPAASIDFEFQWER